jgi:tetratricopeptide (TPR) repeat protein
VLESLLPRFKPLVSKQVGLALGLWGEAGIGKTYRGQQLLGQIPCKSFCLHSTVPLAQLAQTLPSSSRLEVWAETIMTRLGRGEIIPADTAADAIVALLAKLAPVVLYLEDLHEAPPERMGFIEQLARRIRRSKGIGLLVTSRGELPESIEGIGLRPLSAEDSNALLVKLSGAELPGQAREWIFARAAGNPLFTTEYFRHLTRMGNIWSDGQRWHWRAPQHQAMPATVEALLEQQILQIGASPSKALQARAMLPQETSQETWAAVAGLEAKEFEEAMLLLQQQGLLQEMKFAHPLYREMVKNSLRPQQRQALALRAIEALETDPQQAAHYLDEAGLEAEPALSLLKRAEQHALALGDEIAVAVWKSRAVAYAVGPEQGRLALEAAEGLKTTDLRQAQNLAELAVSLLPLNAQSIYLLAELMAASGQKAEALATLERLPSEQQNSPEHLDFVFGLLVLIRDQAGILALWRSHPQLNLAQHPKAANAISFALAIGGQTGEAEEVVLKALAHPDLSVGQRCGLINNLGSAHYTAGNFAQAERFYAQSLELARAHNLADIAVVYATNQALVLGAMERRFEQAAALEAILQSLNHRGQPRQILQTQLALADSYLALGQYTQAEELLLASHQILSRHPDDYLVECEYRLSILYRNHSVAYGGILSLKYGHAAVMHARTLQNPRPLLWSLCYAAFAEARFGNPEQATRLADEAVQMASQSQSPSQKAMAAFAQAQALEALHPDQALSRYRQIESELWSKDFSSPAQEVGLEGDRLERNAVKAAERLGWFEQHSLINLANRARRYFPQLGEEGDGGRVTGDGNDNSLSRHPTTDTRHPILSVLGPMQLHHNGQAQPLRGRKRQVLLALLLEARIAARAEVSRLALLETLYPEEGELKASATLKQLVSSLRESLSEGAILTTATGYALGQVQSDAEAFLQTGDPALWRGAYLQDLNLNTGADDILYLALSAKVKTLLSENPAEAARLGRILLEDEPYSPESLQLCLLALKATGNYKTLGRLYEDAKERMREIGQGLPEKWGEFLSQTQ